MWLIRIKKIYFSALGIGVSERFCSQRHSNLEMLFEAKIRYNYIKDLVATSNRSYTFSCVISYHLTFYVSDVFSNETEHKH